jgi:aspartyl protease family protein
VRLLKLVMLTTLLFTVNVRVFAGVQAVGLMPNMAIIEVDGQRVVIRKGETKQGVRLIESDSHHAKIEYNGKKLKLKLGSSIASRYTAPKIESVRLHRADNGHYFTQVKINGRTVNTLVDTGATTVAISSDLAKYLGINYAKGQKGRSSTASGIVTSYFLRADHIQIGTIKKYNVPLSVIEGSFPDIPLLGMSFLNQFGLNEKNGVLTLTDK